MKKVIRDGQVAVLVSIGYGAGWSTWNTDHKELLFHPRLVEMVENEKQSEINELWVNENIGISDVYCGGASDLRIVWLDEGVSFTIEEYDGSESMRTNDDLTFNA